MTTAVRTITANQGPPVWQAEVGWEVRCYIPVVEDQPEAKPEGQSEDASAVEPKVTYQKLWDCFVDVFRPGHAPIRFRVNRRGGRPVSVTDPRDRLDAPPRPGAMWETPRGLDRNPPKPPRPRFRSLTLVEFQRELSKLVGPERAEQIIEMTRS